MYLFRPVLAEPPLCCLADLHTTVTLPQLADMHELLDVRDALTRKARAEAERNAPNARR